MRGQVTTGRCVHIKENPGFENPGITLGSPYRIRTGDLRLERAAS